MLTEYGIVNDQEAIKVLKKRILRADENGEDATIYRKKLNEIRAKIAKECAAEIEPEIGYKGEPEFPLSLVLQRISVTYEKAYREGQEDLSIVTDFKVKQLEDRIKFWQARDRDGWGYWRDEALSLGKQLKDAKKNISFLESSERAARFLHDKAEQKIKQLDKEIGKLEERKKISMQNESEDYKAKWLKSEADKIEILQSGFARR